MIGTGELIPQTEIVDSRALSVHESAKALLIASNDDYVAADRLCVSLREIETDIIETFKDAKQKAFEAHRAVTAAEKKHLEPVQDARKLLKIKMGSWQEKQETERRRKEAELREEERRRAEEEALAKAVKAEESGNAEEADAIIAEPLNVAPVIVRKETPKADTAIRKAWKFRVKDINIVPRKYLAVDEKSVGQVVRALKDKSDIPGIEVYWDYA
ncbi:MAG: hypothetical protein KGJ13_08325 [Patescibacteria group bacterium]|nr:hypothetical protein [Patescibacteria group bacterium]